MQKNRIANSEKQVLILFLILSGIFYVLKNLIDQTTVNYNVLIFGNLLLFIVCWTSIRMSIKAVRHENVQVFLRLMYGSFILKFFRFGYSRFYLYFDF